MIGLYNRLGNEKLIEKVFDIPKISDEKGKYWEQPEITDITIIGDSAIMSKKTYNKLSRYDYTNPSGVYSGKIWRRHNFLCWYDDRFCPSGYCDIFKKDIIIRN